MHFSAGCYTTVFFFFCAHSVAQRMWATLIVNLLWRSRCWHRLVKEDISQLLISCSSKTLTLLLVGASNLYFLNIQFVHQFLFSNFCKYSWLQLQLFITVLHSDTRQHFLLWPMFVHFDETFLGHFYELPILISSEW